LNTIVFGGVQILEREMSEIASSLAFVLAHVRSMPEKRLVVYEFWHLLKRKGLVDDKQIEWLINETLRKLA